MPKKSKDKGSCEEQCCYQVSAVIAVDARGQMVLPKDVREKMGINPGDKLAVIMHESSGRPCCLSMMRVNDLSMMVSGPLGEALKEKETR